MRDMGAAVLVTVALAAGLVAAPPAQAQRDQGVDCQKCHANKEFLVGKAPTPQADSALFVPDSLLRDSKHRGLICTACHPGFAGGYPHPDTTIAVPCQSCHPAEGAAWARSIHATNALTVGDAPKCVGCHGSPHHILGADDRRSPTYPLNVAALCGRCHADPRIIGTYFMSPEQAQARTAVKEYYQTVHGMALTQAGLVVSATCNDCHGAHEILPADSPQSTVNRAHIAQTCGKCHAGVLEEYDASSHGMAYRTGVTTATGHHAPVCVDCHTAHKIVRADQPTWFLGVVEECGSCHERLYETYFETYHGQVTELGFGLTAKCSDCHTAHSMLPPTDPRSSVYPGNLVHTCGQCHPKANANFVKYYPHGDPKNRQRYPRLYWPWLFMTALLVTVFLFFGTHSLLWLGRLAVNRLRGRRGQGHDGPPGTEDP